MIVKITCTASEKEQIKLNLKTNQSDTEVTYKPILKKPDDVTCGEYVLSKIIWELEDKQ